MSGGIYEYEGVLFQGDGKKVDTPSGEEPTRKQSYPTPEQSAEIFGAVDRGRCEIEEQGHRTTKAEIAYLANLHRQRLDPGLYKIWHAEREKLQALIAEYEAKHPPRAEEPRQMSKPNDPLTQIVVDFLEQYDFARNPPLLLIANQSEKVDAIEKEYFAALDHQRIDPGKYRELKAERDKLQALIAEYEAKHPPKENAK